MDIWIFLAMAAFVGLRLLFERIKRNMQGRQEIFEDSYEEEAEEYYQQPANPPPPPLPTNQQQNSAPQTLQELFEQRRQQIAESQRSPQNQAPTKQETPKAEQPAVTSKPPTPPTKIELNSAFALKGIKADKKEKSGVSKILSDRETTRSAMILHEVLGKPKGL